MKKLSAFFTLIACVFLSLNVMSQTADISGTILTNSTEEDIRTGGSTIIITLTGETWAEAVGFDNDTTTALINSFTGSGGWSVISAALDTTMILRISATIVEITLPPIPSFDIYADETISLNIDETALETLTSNLSATNSFDILHDPVSITLGGSVTTSDTESDIRNGLSTIELELVNDIWDSELGNDNPQTTDLLNGITGDQDWADVTLVLDYTNVERVSDNLLRISIPVISDYFISVDENVSIVVPSGSFANYGSSVVAPGFQIADNEVSVTLSGTIFNGSANTEANIRSGGSTIVINLSGDEWKSQVGSNAAMTMEILNGISNSTGTAWDTYVKPALTVDRLVVNSPTQVTITLPIVATYDINENENISILISGNTLKSNSADDFPAESELTIQRVTALITIGGNIFTGSNNTEDAIRAGGSTISLTLAEDLWVAGIGDASAATQDLINGITGGTSWNTVVIPAILGSDQGASNVSISGNTVTVNIPAVSEYNTLTDDVININVPASCLQFTASGSISGNTSLTITPGSGEISVGGNIFTGTNDTEDAIRAGGSTISLTLEDDVWVTGMGDANAATQALVNGITGGASWNSTVLPAILGSDQGASNVSISGNIVTVTIPAVSGYNTLTDDVININVPASCLQYTVTGSISGNTSLTIIRSGAELTIGGNILSGSNDSEDAIRSGGSTISLTLTDDVWATGMGDASAVTQSLVNGITGGASWNAVVIPAILGSDQGASNVSISGNTVTVTIPAASGYNTLTDDVISISIPASCFQYTTSGSISGNTSLNIARSIAKITVGGNILSGSNNTEAAIRAGGSTISLTLADDVWTTGMGDAGAVTAALVNGITGSTSWNSAVRSAILGSDQGAANVAVSGNIVTVTIPAVPLYDAVINDIISVSVPASCLQYTSVGSISGNTSLTILIADALATISSPVALNESSLTGSSVTLILTDESFNTTSPPVSAFTVTGASQISVSSVTYVSPTEVTLILSQVSDFDEAIEFSINVSGTVLERNESVLTNELSVAPVIEPEILGISVPVGTYGIGDEIQLEISVNTDGGIPYTYHSGTVAGKTLHGVIKVSNTLYYGYITVAEGDQDYSLPANIPVSNLRFDQGTINGELFSGNISLPGVAIDAHRPVINYLQGSGGIKKIGDIVEIIISADGNGYTAVPALTSVNGYLLSEVNISFVELGGGVYILRYIVEEGNTDVISGNLQASLVLRDFAGNQSDVANTIVNNTVTVDANAPIVNSITVDDNTYSIDDVITVNFTADGNNYTALNESSINGIPLSSSNVTFTNLGGNSYRFLYTVRSIHAEVNPGELEVSIILRDLAGNISSPFTNLAENNLAIYTLLPTSTLFGNQQICEDDSARLIVNLTGKGPWNIYLNDGSGNDEYPNINASPYEIYVNPENTTTYSIDSVVDVNGIRNIGSGIAMVTVNLKSFVEIMNLSSGYSVDDSPVVLIPNVSGGTFSGPGIISSGNIFDPGIADTINSPHTIYYNYVNSFGCRSTDSSLVFVLGAEGDIFIPKAVFCDYNNPFIVSGSNTAGSIGSYKLLNSGGQEVTGLTDNLDNTAIIDPQILNPELYTVRYTYEENEVILVINENFRVETVQQPKIITLNQNSYCRNVPSFSLEGDIETAVFAGPGVSGNVNDGFIFNPATASLGNINISYTNTTVNGCVSAISKLVRIDDVPNLNFTESDVCLSPGEFISFTNNTSNKNVVSEWYWNFGDINSGENNVSNSESAQHIFTKSGSRKVLLVGITEEGCIDSLERIIDFGDKPSGNFNWTSDCFVENDSIKFVFDSGDVPVVSYSWRFYTAPDTYVEKTGSPTAYFSFSDTAEYRVDLYTETNIGCSNTFSRNINLKPTIILEDTPYYEEFDEGAGKWSAVRGENSQYNSWQYGLVNFNGLGDGVSNAWYTVLPSAELNEQSYVISPCFDLRKLERPMIRLDYLQSLDANREGAVLQTSVDQGQSWQNVGNLNDGINWYNSYQISNRPGGQDVGWTGKQPFSPDQRWIEARHHLSPELSKSDNVRFRLAFASAHDSKENREGFAFDNIWLGSRNKKVLLEHFTNVNHSESRENNAFVNFLFVKSYSDIVKLEYHTAFPGADPMNNHNKAVPATRALFYGISQVPYTVMDGVTMFDYNSSSLDKDDVYIESLKDPLFDIDITMNAGSNSLTANVAVTALADLFPQERILQVVVFEKLIEDLEFPSGEANFLHVVKAMLPNAAGTAFFDGWAKDETRSFDFNWEYANMYDPEMVRIAAFVQDDYTKEVYQAVTSDTTNISTARPAESFRDIGLTVYPNPASDELNLLLKDDVTAFYNIEIYDQMGRKVLQEEWDTYEKLKKLNVSSFNKGVYILRLSDKQGKVLSIQRVIVF